MSLLRVLGPLIGLLLAAPVALAQPAQAAKAAQPAQATQAAQPPSKQAPPQADPAPGELCRAPAYRQLDYNIGRFRVMAESGAAAGRLHVQSILSGCALRGRWRGAIAGTGDVTMWYDRDAQQWHHVFVNDDGNTLRLSGRVEGTRLVLTGRNAFFDGRTGLHRMTRDPQPDGSYRQTWEFSTDEGRTWEMLLASRALPER